MAKGREENLKPLNTRTKKEQREIAKMGGIKSGEARRGKKIITEIYSNFLFNKHNFNVYYQDQKGKLKKRKVKKTGKEMLDNALRDIINDSRGSVQSARVSIVKELREAIDGQKIDLGDMPPPAVNVYIQGVPPKEKNKK